MGCKSCFSQRVTADVFIASLRHSSSLTQSTGPGGAQDWAHGGQACRWRPWELTRIGSASDSRDRRCFTPAGRDVNGGCEDTQRSERIRGSAASCALAGVTHSALPSRRTHPIHCQPACLRLARSFVLSLSCFSLDNTPALTRSVASLYHCSSFCSRRFSSICILPAAPRPRETPQPCSLAPYVLLV